LEREFKREFERFSEMSAGQSRGFTLRWADRYPCLDDRTRVTEFDRHYVYHTAWAARVVTQLRPAYHVDIASSLYFAALLSAYVPVRFFDFRPANLRLSNLTVGGCDLTALPFSDGSVASLSCMHVVEHIGLGRYGDPLDPDGDLKAIAELIRVLAPGGSLLFVVLVGCPAIRFNAHRVYSPMQILQHFAGLQLVEFSAIDDNGWLNLDIQPGTMEGAQYACGLFHFSRGSCKD
jgi:SAM-dependent methyltransferase